MLITLLVILLVCAVVGGVGHSQWGFVGWSPLGVVLVVILIMYFTGHLGRLR